jgi:S1-C subfamily serine protease
VVFSIDDLDIENDICLIELPGHGLVPLKLANSVSLGEKVYVVGAPMGFLGFIFDGFVANLGVDMSEGYLDKLLVSAASAGGNSGGPVVNEAGEVVGILIAGDTNFDHLSICTKAKYVKKFLEKSGIK